MSLYNIRMELARTKSHPDGSKACGYELLAPLDAEGRLDLDAFRKVKESCLVRRFWENEDDRHGRLEHTQGRVWKFAYDDAEDVRDEEEPLHRLDRHLFKVGEYVSVTEWDGEKLPFIILSVRPMS